MTKAWWLGFPRFHCPHCGKLIEGIKFVGKFKLPRVRRESGKDSKDEGHPELRGAVSPTAAAKRTRKPRRDVERGVTGL